MIDRFSLIWGLMIGMFTTVFYSLTETQVFWITIGLVFVHGAASFLDAWATAPDGGTHE